MDGFFGQTVTPEIRHLAIRVAAEQPDSMALGKFSQLSEVRPELK
jgi:hypothetical protein